MNKNSKKAYLLLANGVLFEGKAMGLEGETVGEIVFSTGMTAYQETLTDPSYYGQIVTHTFPLIGNYGTNSEDFESEAVFLNGYIVREYCELPSNFRCEDTINSFLIKHNVVGICDIDTRRLTRILRDSGVMNGMITTNEIKDINAALKKIAEFKIIDAVENTARKEKYQLACGASACQNGKKYNLAMLDFGHSRSLLKQLGKYGFDVTVLPYDTLASEIAERVPDGIVLSDGAGDPALNTALIENLREIIKLQIPIFGVSLGHQLLALANGIKTTKLKHGHRGANQPVIDYLKDRTFITSQNHGYAVMTDSLSENVGKVSHINANDHSCEGIIYKNIPAISVQFHLETGGGPQDTSHLFDEFLNLIECAKKEEK